MFPGHPAQNPPDELRSTKSAPGVFVPEREGYDDTERGGDIDLLIDVSKPLTRRVKVECRLAAILFIKLGGRKVDVLIREPNQSLLPIHEQAIRQGVVL